MAINKYVIFVLFSCPSIVFLDRKVGFFCAFVLSIEKLDFSVLLLCRHYNASVVKFFHLYFKQRDDE